MKTIPELKKAIDQLLEDGYTVIEAQEATWAYLIYGVGLLAKESLSETFTKEDYEKARRNYHRLGQLNIFGLPKEEATQLRKEYDEASNKYLRMKEILEKLSKPSEEPLAILDREIDVATIRDILHNL